VNDTKGHQAGDDLLIEFAAILSRAFGNDACLARLGGDEFAAIISVASLNELEQSLEDIFYANRLAIGGLFTHSCGAVFTSSRYSTSRVLRVADTSLYEAKARGRNCFVVKDLDEVSIALATAPKGDPSLDDLDQLR
jgi:diguanylate cyclase (GGDEF)-like protein